MFVYVTHTHSPLAVIASVFASHWIKIVWIFEEFSPRTSQIFTGLILWHVMDYCCCVFGTKMLWEKAYFGGFFGTRQIPWPQAVCKLTTRAVVSRHHRHVNITSIQVSVSVSQQSQNEQFLGVKISHIVSSCIGEKTNQNFEEKKFKQFIAKQNIWTLCFFNVQNMTTNISSMGQWFRKVAKKKKKKHNTKQHVFFKVGVVIFFSFCQTNIFENFSRPKEALDEGISIQESAKCFQDRAPRFQAPQPQITCSCQNRRRAPPPNVFLSLAAFKIKMSGPRLMHVPVKPTSSSSSLVTNPRWAMPVRSTKLPFSLRFGSMMICTASQLGPASSQLSPHFSFKLSVRTAWCIRSMACSWLSNARNMSEICFPLLYQPLTLVEERLVALKRLKDACKAAAAHLGESWLGQFAVNVGGKERKKWWVAFTMSWSMKSHDTWTGRSGNCSCFRARANDLKTVSVFNKGLSSWSPFLSRSLNSLSSLPAMAVLITPIWKWTLRKNLFKLTHWDTSGGFSRSSFPPSLTILSFSSKTDWAASTLNVKTWFNTSLPLPNTVRRSLVTSWTNRKEPARILVNKSSWLSLSALNVLPCDRRNSLAKSTNISRSTKFVSNEGGFPSPPTMSATTRLPWGRKTGCGRGYCLFSKIPATLTPCLVLLSNWRQKGGSSWMPTLQLLYLLSNR